MITYIEEHRRSFGVEPICRTLAIAPSSYYAALARPPSARAIRDEVLSAEITRVHAEHFRVYGVRKAWRALRREGIEVGRDRVGRLMRALGLAGATRTRRVRTTQPAPVGQRPADLVERVFAAPAPNRLWVADLTYVWTRTGFVYAAFVVDAFSRSIVGWRVAASLRTDLALDARDGPLGEGLRAPWPRPSRRSRCPYLAIRSTERLAEAGGRQLGRKPRGLVRQRPRRDRQRALQGRAHRPSRTLADGRAGRARHPEWVHFWNTRRLHSACGDVPPAEYEAAYHQRQAEATAAA